ncbi:hypothetical protein JCM10213_007125 [Rhodosporidiobolus nylandii]
MRFSGLVLLALFGASFSLPIQRRSFEQQTTKTLATRTTSVSGAVFRFSQNIENECNLTLDDDSPTVTVNPTHFGNGVSCGDTVVLVSSTGSSVEAIVAGSFPEPLYGNTVAGLNPSAWFKVFGSHLVVAPARQLTLQLASAPIPSTSSAAPQPTTTPPPPPPPALTTPAPTTTTPAPAPTPTPAAPAPAAPAPAPVVANIASAEFSGDGTWYTQDGTAGSCGIYHSDSDFIVALNLPQMGANEHCGARIRITNPANGMSAEVVVSDTCMGCAYGSLDLSVGAFKSLSFADDRAPITWSFI